MTVRNRKSALALLPATLALMTPAFAQLGHPRNVIERHPTATGVAAGVAVHHALKVKAARDKRAGRRLNFAERHPTLTGIAAGAATRHIIKKRTPHY